MYANEIRMIYTQLKACYKQEFNDYLIRDDTYKDYYGRCETQKKEILDFYLIKNYARLDEINDDLQMMLGHRVDSLAVIFNYFGWTDKQIKNM